MKEVRCVVQTEPFHHSFLGPFHCFLEEERGEGGGRLAAMQSAVAPQRRLSVAAALLAGGGFFGAQNEINGFMNNIILTLLLSLEHSPRMEMEHGA